jgi:hypothetical protein
MRVAGRDVQGMQVLRGFAIGFRAHTPRSQCNRIDIGLSKAKTISLLPRPLNMIGGLLPITFSSWFDLPHRFDRD